MCTNNPHAIQSNLKKRLLLVLLLASSVVGQAATARTAISILDSEIRCKCGFEVRLPNGRQTLIEIIEDNGIVDFCDSKGQDECADYCRNQFSPNRNMIVSLNMIPKGYSLSLGGIICGRLTDGMVDFRQAQLVSHLGCRAKFFLLTTNQNRRRSTGYSLNSSIRCRNGNPIIQNDSQNSNYPNYPNYPNNQPLADQNRPFYESTNENSQTSNNELAPGNVPNQNPPQTYSNGILFNQQQQQQNRNPAQYNNRQPNYQPDNQLNNQPINQPNVNSQPNSQLNGQPNNPAPINRPPNQPPNYNNPNYAPNQAPNNRPQISQPNQPNQFNSPNQQYNQQNSQTNALLPDKPTATQNSVDPHYSQPLFSFFSNPRRSTANNQPASQLNSANQPAYAANGLSYSNSPATDSNLRTNANQLPINAHHSTGSQNGHSSHLASQPNALAGNEHGNPSNSPTSTDLQPSKLTESIAGSRGSSMTHSDVKPHAL